MKKSIIAVIGLGIFSIGSLTFGESWKSEKSKAESDRWKTEIQNWDAMHEAWYAKRKEYYEKTFGDRFDRTDGKYCDTKGCFEEGIFDISYKGEKKQFHISAHNFDFQKGTISWKQENGGQVLEYNNVTTQEKWESSNYGQSLGYRDEEGNTWESSNYGQFIAFHGVSGEEWTSSNYGQSLQFKDKNGKTWESSNFGQSVQKNGEEEEFDMQEDLFENF